MSASDRIKRDAVQKTVEVLYKDIVEGMGLRTGQLGPMLVSNGFITSLDLERCLRESDDIPYFVNHHIRIKPHMWSILIKSLIDSKQTIGYDLLETYNGFLLSLGAVDILCITSEDGQRITGTGSSHASATAIDPNSHMGHHASEYVVHQNVNPTNEIRKKDAKLFISFPFNSNYRRDAVLRMADRLRSRYSNVWDATRAQGNIAEGRSTAIKQADVVLCFYSQEFADDKDCPTELSYAVRKLKNIVPIKIQEDYKLGDNLDYQLNNLQTIDFSENQPFEWVFNQICQAVDYYV